MIAILFMKILDDEFKTVNPLFSYEIFVKSCDIRKGYNNVLNVRGDKMIKPNSEESNNYFTQKNTNKICWSGTTSTEKFYSSMAE